MLNTKTVEAGERTQFTPGPWLKNNLSIVVADGSVIAHAGISTTLEVPVQHANARLIAAAPELLEFARAIVEMTEGQAEIDKRSVIEPGVTIQRKARQVVANAEGKE